MRVEWLEECLWTAGERCTADRENRSSENSSRDIWRYGPLLSKCKDIFVATQQILLYIQAFGTDKNGRAEA